MAVGIARKRLGTSAALDSAGLAAVEGPAAEDAQLVMKLVYKTDISGHRAKSYGSIDPAAFDYIIAMDFLIYNSLRDIWTVSEDKLYGWDIEDPLGLGYDAFKETALNIERRLDQFLVGNGLD